MRLFIVRHGQALDKATNPERPLSENGRAEVQKAADFLKGKVYCRSIWHSTKLRAIQTATIFREADIGLDLIERGDLNPMDSVYPFVEEINKENEDLMIVGHLPFIFNLTSALLKVKLEQPFIHFFSSDVVAMERVVNWNLLWVISPQIL